MTFNKPLRANTFGPLIFTCSWSDWFLAQADTWRPDAWRIIKQCQVKWPERIFQILTKRPDRIPECLPDDWGDGYPNVWLGVSVESNDYRYRILQLNQIAARVKFISYEPALGVLHLDKRHLDCLDWVIAGDESGGPGEYRLAEIYWFHTILEQCNHAGVPFFMKQICRKGRPVPYDEFPDSLKLRMFPEIEGRKCRECDCSLYDPCLLTSTGEPCHWVGWDLCSQCDLESIRKGGWR